MESLFENVYTDTKESVRELFAQRYKVIRWIFLPLFSVEAVIFLLGLLLVDPKRYWFLFLVCAAGACYYFFLPRIQTGRYFRHMMQHYDGAIPETRVIFTEEDITIWFGQDCSHVPYNKITSVYFGKHILLLRAGKVMSATLMQDAFVKGSKEELVKFLQAKCPNLKMKIPDWKW